MPTAQAVTRPGQFFALLALLTMLALTVFKPVSVRGDASPPGCTGSGLGILLFTDSPDVHIGDTLRYSVTVFNGTGVGPIVCDATSIEAFIVTPDGVRHVVTLARTTLLNGQSDYYKDVVTYVVRAQDVQPDATLRATATDTGTIHQNDTNSQGGGNQGVNTEVSLPCIQIAVQCVGAIGENGALNFTGSVTNCGNNTLVGVTITNSVNGVLVPVAFINTLARGQVATFSGSWIPSNPCNPSTATFVATGIDQFTTNPRTVTSSASTTCSQTLTPGIRVLASCPEGPVRPGQLLVFSGSVQNTGNVTLTGIVVVNQQPVANTTVFTLASLAPGAVANFTGSYLSPTNCSATQTLTANASSLCGVPVTSTASATCPILTTPMLAITAVCPAVSVAPGGAMTYTGTVRNTGDIALKNVVVVSDHPTPNTQIFAAANLAPGASVNFTGSHTAPNDVCTVVTGLRVTGVDVCTSLTVTESTSITCLISTTPRIAVTLACPTAPSATGGLITFTGTVSNTGNVTLNNVTVVDAQASPATVLTIEKLAPGASANFTAKFTSPANACSISSTVTAQGSDACSSVVVSNVAAATCTLLTSPQLAITQTCPVNQVGPGGLLTFSGTVRNTGDITVSNIVVINDLSGAIPILTAASLAPGATIGFTGSFTVAANVCSVSSTSTVRGTSICGVAVSNSASSTCPIVTASQILVTTQCPTSTTMPGGTLTFTGTVKNSGNITLLDVVVVSDRPIANTPVFTVASLAPGASANFTGSFVVPTNACSVTTAVQATGKDFCGGNSVTNIATSTCTVTTAPSIAVTLSCPTVLAAPGALVTYTGLVSNPGNVTLNNVTVVNAQSSPSTVLTIASLAPGGTASFTVKMTTPLDDCSVTAEVTASGLDNCTSVVVSKSTSATCPLLTAPAIAVTQDCPVAPVSPGGLFTFAGTVRNTGNIALTNVVVAYGATSLPPSINQPEMTLWFDDGLSSDAVKNSDGGDSWVFVSNSPAPFSGTNSHQSSISAGRHQHYFTSASSAFAVEAGDILVAYIYIDPANIPKEVMLQWNDGSWEHRAYWGENLIPYGNEGTVSRQFVGALPEVGKWVRLEVPAAAVGLEGRRITGMAFSLYGGRASWDAAGKMNSKKAPSDDVSPAVPGSTIFSIARLAPGEVANFNGSFTLPTNSGCSITTSLVASGRDRCTGMQVAGTTTSTCPLITDPSLEVTQLCPVTPGVQGGTLTFTGTVKNTGNITLTNVIVMNDRVGTSPVFSAALLAPGQIANFTGSYIVPVNCCSVSSTVSASARDICTGERVADTATSTCPVLTNPGIAVTKTCTPQTLEPGDVLKYTGTVSNTGNITLIDVTIVNNQPGPNTPVFGPITLAPGETVTYYASYTVPVDFCGTDTVTARGINSCTGLAVVDSATTHCPVTTTPRIAVVKFCPDQPTPRGGVHRFSGTVSNPGNVTLINVVVVNNQPSNNTPVIGPIGLLPGASVTFHGSYIAPLDCCETTDTLTASAIDNCSKAPVKATASAICPMLTTPGITISEICPTTTVAPGGTFEFHGVVSNSGDVNLTNVVVFSNRAGGISSKVFGPIELAPGESAEFDGSYIVPANGDVSTDVVLASGTDTCKQRTVTAQANCTGLVNLSDLPKIKSVNLVNGVATVAWNSVQGVTYMLQCKASPLDPIWIDIPGTVTATGSAAEKTDAVGPTKQRFYRVLVMQN